MRTIFLLLLVLYFASCTPPSNSEEPSRLGSIELAVTGTVEALPHFERGLLLLHSFEYRDARQEFLKAQELDPDLAMAYWGEAMSYHNGLWSEQEYEAGTAALQKLRDEARTEASPLEQDFLQAMDVLYAANKPKAERDQAYADYMKDMHERYPDNHEVAAFYALSLLGSVEDRDDEIYGQGAAIAQNILTKNAQHPGALHYLIHSYDDPKHAFMALEVANSYSKVAPDASHALHMPSHIYVALGMWDQVVASNEASYGASVAKMEREDKDNDGRSYHAYHWLQYGYLQQGRATDAEELLKNMHQYATETPSKYARRHLAYMRGTYLVETDSWDNPWASTKVEVSDLNILVKAMDNFTNGMAAYQKQNAEGVQTFIAAIEEDIEQEKVRVQNQNIATCSALTREVPSQLDIDYARVMVLQLQSFHALLQQNAQEADRYMQEAIALDESVSYSYGPPLIVKPTRELYGEWLLENDRPTEAIEQFKKGLERAPKRVRLLQAKQQAAQEVGDNTLAREIEETLNEISQGSETAV